MNYLLASCFAMVLFSYNCNENRLPSENIVNITVFAITTEGRERVAIVDDRNIAEAFVKSINSSHKELVKFRPNYALEINYDREMRRVLVKENLVNIDGLTYSMGENLGAQIEVIVGNAKR